jgi:threonine/homoserine/homoserine lactone efflux protein
VSATSDLIFNGGLVVSVAGCVYGFGTGRDQLRRAACAFYGLCAYIADTMEHNITGQFLGALYFAYFAYQWWKGGGGDGTKRRLRKLRRFLPVRRTAPAAT